MRLLSSTLCVWRIARSSEGAKRSEGYNHWTTGLDWLKMMFIFPMFGTLWGICFFPLKQIQVGLTIWGSQQSTSGDGDTNAFWEAKPPLSPWVRRHFATRLWFLWWKIQDMGMKSLQSGPIWCFTRTGTSWMHCTSCRKSATYSMFNLFNYFLSRNSWISMIFLECSAFEPKLGFLLHDIGEGHRWETIWRGILRLSSRRPQTFSWSLIWLLHWGPAENWNT